MQKILRAGESEQNRTEIAEGRSFVLFGEVFKTGF